MRVWFAPVSEGRGFICLFESALFNYTQFLVHGERGREGGSDGVTKREGNVGGRANDWKKEVGNV